ncbi:phage tail protein [Nocardia seriolae]|uniref:phage tail protein n=1 Tax=Nocardia seriolae TaxID=37332 RepID=UPI00090A7D19|nr:phage tail protein [Nocardia seriolae]BAW08240.1 phage tail protein [Nocardia seriolae]
MSGLELGVDTIEYKDEFGNRFQMPGQRQSVNLTLRRGLLPADSPLYEWLNTVALNVVEKRDCTISLTDESGETPLVTWTVSDAFPVKLTVPNLDSSTNEVTVEEVSLLGSSVKVEFS